MNSSVSETKTKNNPNGALLFILTLVYGFLFTEFIIRGGFEAGVLITTGLFYLFFIPFVVKKGVKFKLSAWLSVAAVVILSVCCAFFAPGPWTFFSAFTILVLQLLQLPLLCGFSASPFFSFKNFLAGLYSIFVAPVENLITAFRSLGKSGGNGEKRKMGSVGKVLLGLVISLPVIAILIALFSSADEIFHYVINYIKDHIQIDWTGFWLDLIVGGLLALWLFPWIYGYYIAEKKENTDSGRFKGFDATVLSTVVFACDIVYLIFVAIQFAYLFPRNMKLPSGTTYAKYCRSGFFSLVAVIVFTFLLAALTMFLAKKKENGGSKLGIKISLSILTLSNLIIVYSAFYRLRMYIDAYNLSRNRVIAGWAIIAIAITTLILFLRIWVRRFNFNGVIGTTFVVMVIVLNLINTDALVAKINISRHLDQGKSLDYYYLTSENLSTAAVPEILRLYKEGSDEDKEKAKVILCSYYEDTFNSVGESNHQDSVAYKILKANKIKHYTESSVYYQVGELIVCPYDYCGDDCIAGRYFRSCNSFTYCATCGEKYCAYCSYHDCEKETREFSPLECKCDDCNEPSYSWGEECYCEYCGKKLK
ncbi:MAG: DUF4173 domain-containing protein [Clostridia bacterium]|nr:DUF4173 domain-containing protein [Clostridia bacterium]